MSLISTSDEIPRLDGRIRQVGHHMLDLRVVLQRIERHVFAEAALLVATVRHLRGDGDMFVDPDRAGLYLRRDAIGAKYVARPDRGRQSIIAVVGEPYTLRLVVEGQYRQHRPKDFLLHHLIALAGGQHYRRLIVIAACEPRVIWPRAASDDLSTRCPRPLHEALDPLTLP